MNLKPTLAFLRRVVVGTANHLANWAELYAWAPVALLSVLGAAELAYFLTGRRPEENADWLVADAGKCVAAILIILFTSVAKQALFSWYTGEQKAADIRLFICDGAATLLLFAGIITIFILL